MDKNFKPVYVQGTETGSGVIETLEALGGINNCNYKGCRPCIYYISPKNNFICQADEDSQLGSYIMATAEEIKPLRWRAKKGSTYYIISAELYIMETHDVRSPADDNFYHSGNYFKTKEEAKKIAEKIKKILLPE